MINRIEIKDPSNGLGKTGYTVYAYNYSTNIAGYSGAPVYTATDAGNGIYYFNVTTTFKATIIVTGGGSTKVANPVQTRGVILWGDNILTLTPGGSS